MLEFRPTFDPPTRNNGRGPSVLVEIPVEKYRILRAGEL